MQLLREAIALIRLKEEQTSSQDVFPMFHPGIFEFETQPKSFVERRLGDPNGTQTKLSKENLVLFRLKNRATSKHLRSRVMTF